MTQPRSYGRALSIFTARRGELGVNAGSGASP